MKTSLAKQAGTAFLWNAIQLGGVKALFLVRLLVLARLLTPDDFGLFAIAMTASGFFLVITDFGILPALVQRAELDQRHYDAAWTLGFFRGVIIAGVLVLAAPVLAAAFNDIRATNIIRVLAVAIVLDASASIKLASLIRNLEFRSLAWVKLIEVVVDTAVSISLTTVFGVWALVIGALTRSVMSSILSYVVAPYTPRLCFERAAVMPIVNYGRWIFFAGLAVVAGDLLLRTIISRQLGTAELGIYFLAAKVAFLPSDIARELVGSVAFSLYVRLRSDLEKLTKAFRSVFIGMSAVLIPFCALIIALTSSLAEDVLGKQWILAAPIIKLIALTGILGPIGEASAALVKGLGDPYKVTVVEGLQSLLLVVGGLVLIANYGLMGIALAWLLANSVYQAVSATFAHNVLIHPFRGLRAQMAVILFVSAVGASVAMAVDGVLSGIIGFALSALTGTTVMGGLLWFLDRWFSLGFASNISRVFPAVGRLVDSCQWKVA